MKEVPALVFALCLLGPSFGFAQSANKVTYSGGDVYVRGDTNTVRTGKIEDRGARGNLEVRVQEGNTTLRGNRNYKGDCSITSNSDDNSTADCKMGNTTVHGNDNTIERGAIVSTK